MNFSGNAACRKWPIRAAPCGALAVVAAMAMADAALARPRGAWDALLQSAQRRPARAAATSAVPLPRARPAGAPQPVVDDTAAAKPNEAAQPAEPPNEPRPPSACRLALTEAIAIAPSIPDIRTAGGCGGEDLVRLEAVVLADGSRVAVKPAAILRCPMASAVAGFVRDDAAPLAARLNTRLAELDNFDSYECRGRNRVAGAKLSEHGRANALDIRGLRLANGEMLGLTDRAVARPTREAVLRAVCARFSTVLGPGSDGYHEDHIHLDVAERRGGYRICQWDVWDALPQIAPLLPAERPQEAPPRVVAEGKAAADAPAVAAPPNAEDVEDADPAPPPRSRTRKRR